MACFPLPGKQASKEDTQLTLSGSSMKKTDDTSGTALLRSTCSPGRIVAAVV